MRAIALGCVVEVVMSATVPRLDFDCVLLTLAVGSGAYQVRIQHINNQTYTIKYPHRKKLAFRFGAMTFEYQQFV